MNDKNAIVSASVDIEIPFHDCDPMQIVWHGNYARYIEVGRCELLRKFNFDYIEMNATGFLWPIVDMRIKYVASAVYRQVIQVDAHLKEYESRIKIDYLISDKNSGQKLTKATTTQVAVCKATKEMQMESPAVLKQKLESYL